MSASGWVSAGVFSLSSLLAAASNAQDILCLTELGPTSVNGNLNIAARCQLTGTVVRGNVRIFSGGSLIARDVYIQGNVDGDRGDFVNLDDTDIDGNVKLEEFVGDLSVIQNSNFRGNVELRRNRSRFEIVNSSFYSNLHAVDGTGGLLISGNSVGGHLQCSGNDPAPTGLGNLIDRDASGQCEDLAPEETSPTIPPRPTTPTTSPPPTTVTPPPTTVAPPATVSPPPSAPATPEPLPRVEKEGLGALDWSAALLLLPLLAWRRFRQRRRTSGA